MAGFLSRLRLFAGILLYVIILAGVLLYFRFPTGRLVTYGESLLVQKLPVKKCEIDDIYYRFPLGLAAGSITCEGNSGGQEVINLQNVGFSPVFSSPLSRFDVGMDAYDGSISFVLEIDREEQTYGVTDISIRELDLGRIPFLGEFAGREINGRLAVDGNMLIKSPGAERTMSGKGEVQLVGGRLGLLMPIIGLDVIDLRKLNSNLVFENSILQCEKGSFHGRELEGAFAGSVDFASGTENAILDLTGHMVPSPEFQKESKAVQNMVSQMRKQERRGTIPFSLRGTVKKPRFTLEF